MIGGHHMIEAIEIVDMKEAIEVKSVIVVIEVIVAIEVIEVIVVKEVIVGIHQDQGEIGGAIRREEKMVMEGIDMVHLKGSHFFKIKIIEIAIKYIVRFLFPFLPIMRVHVIHYLILPVKDHISSGVSVADSND